MTPTTRLSASKRPHPKCLNVNSLSAAMAGYARIGAALFQPSLVRLATLVTGQFTQQGLPYYNWETIQLRTYCTYGGLTLAPALRVSFLLRDLFLGEVYSRALRIKSFGNIGGAPLSCIVGLRRLSHRVPSHCGRQPAWHGHGLSKVPIRRQCYDRYCCRGAMAISYGHGIVITPPWRCLHNTEMVY